MTHHFAVQIGITGLQRSSKGTNLDKLGHGNGLYWVTDPRKCLIHRVGHSSENRCVSSSIPRGATTSNRYRIPNSAVQNSIVTALSRPTKGYYCNFHSTRQSTISNNVKDEQLKRLRLLIAPLPRLNGDSHGGQLRNRVSISSLLRPASQHETGFFVHTRKMDLLK